MRLFLLAFTALLFAGQVFAGEVTFHYDRKDAQTVQLAGEFNNWKAQAMTKDAQGIWTITIPLAPGTYGYKFLVNGTDWNFDPAAQQRKQVNGIENSAIEVTDSSAPAAKSTSSPSASESKTSATDLSITPGEVATFVVPLSASEQTQAVYGGNPATATAKIALGVPANFDPQNSWPLLIISSTVNASSIDLLAEYRQATLAAGWVILAADASVPAVNDNTSRRLAVIEAALDFLVAHCPAAKLWPIAAGGFSGGAKRSAFVAAALFRERRNVIGMLMGGCNEDTATAGLKKFSPPFNFTAVPIFLSSGASDPVATPEEVKAVELSMKASGFRNIRLESYPGVHEVYPDHTTEALRWFTSWAAANATPAPKSDFDSFFKKK